MTSEKTTTPEGDDQVFYCLLEASNSRKSSLIPPPEKHSIRLVENYRQKFDGRSWRLVCTWGNQECTNFAVSSKICKKHNAERRNKLLPLPNSKLIKNLFKYTLFV